MHPPSDRAPDRPRILPVLLPRGQAWVTYVALLGVFGLLVPWAKGLEFLDPVILIAYACLGSIFAGPAAVQLFDQVPRTLGEALRRILAAVAFGELVVIVLLIMGLGTVRFAHRGIFPFDLGTLLAGLALGLGLCLAMCSMAAWVRTSYSASVSRTALRVVFVALLIGFLYRSQWLPDVALIGAGFALLLALVFLALLARKVRT